MYSQPSVHAPEDLYPPPAPAPYRCLTNLAGVIGARVLRATRARWLRDRGVTRHLERTAIMLAGIQIALSLSILSTFVGPLGPRTGASTGTVSGDQPPAMGKSFTDEELRSLLRHRHALVIAGEDTATALAVAEGLVDVGASVIFGCARPERAARRVDRINAKARANEAQLQAAGGEIAATTADPGEDGGGQWCAGCEARPLDLSSSAGVYRFADGFLAEGRPLHIIINCADDHHAIFRAPPDGDGAIGWERTAASNHLGPFLLTQLLLDQVVGTMRADARRSARAKHVAARSGGSSGSSSGGSRGQPGRRTSAKAKAEAGDGDGGGVLGEATELRPRPYPAPLGRCVTLGLDARLGVLQPGAAPPALGGLYLRPLNYSGWRAYRCAHEANTLATLQLARMLPAVRVPSGEHVEANIVRPSRFRWLPAPLRRRLGAVDGAALTTTFLASTPMRGLHGLYFSDFATEPAWRKSARGAAGPAAAYAAKQVYAASMARVRAPPADWRSEATMVLRGMLGRLRRPRAVVRGRRRASAEGERAAGAVGEGEAQATSGGGASRSSGRDRQWQPRQPLEVDVDELVRGAG